MTLRSLTAAALVAASLGGLATPAFARTVTVMGMTFQQPGQRSGDVRQGDVATTGSVAPRYGTPPQNTSLRAAPKR